MEDEQDFTSYGLKVKAIHIPGHSKGSIGILKTNNDHASITSVSWMEGQEGNDMQTSFPEGTVLVNVFEDPDQTDDEVVVGADGKVVITVQPRGGKIYVAAK